MNRLWQPIVLWIALMVPAFMLLMAERWAADLAQTRAVLVAGTVAGAGLILRVGTAPA